MPAPIIGHANCRTELIEKFDAKMQRYRSGRPDLPLATFPEACPWSVTRVLEENFWPEE